MRVWKVFFDVQFKIERKIEKIVNSNFYPNMEFWFLAPKSNLPFIDCNTNFEVINLKFSLFISKLFFTYVQKRYLVFVFKKNVDMRFLIIWISKKSTIENNFCKI